jgi:hypothetical protein
MSAHVGKAGFAARTLESFRYAAKNTVARFRFRSQNCSRHRAVLGSYR